MDVAELDPGRVRLQRALPNRRSIARAPTLPAIERYTGVLYRELDAATLTAVARRRLDRFALIASGMWGLVAPADPIPDYRLKMGGRLDGLGKLSTWWRPQVTAALAPRVARARVWDLLPIEHAAAVDWTVLEPHERVTVRFVDGRGKTISHWNKLLKGSLVRWLITNGSADVDDLAGLSHPQGYCFDPAATERDGRHTSVVFREN